LPKVKIWFWRVVQFSHYRRHLKSATAKIEKHQREIVQAENNHRTAIVGTETGSDDKGKPIN